MMIEDAQNFYGIYYEGGKMDNRFSPKNTTVIICCAGMGTRLGIGTTKALIDIEGKPLIIRLLEQLNQYDDIRIVVGFDYERVIKTVQSYRKDIMFVFNYDYKTTGTIESLRRALKCARDIVITLDGDVILNEKDFQYFLQYENECIAVAQNASNEPLFADVINGQVVHLEKYESEGDFQWSGITKISRDKLLEFETERHEYDLLNRFMPLEACIVSLKEVNTQEDYESALSWFKNKLDQ